MRGSATTLAWLLPVPWLLLLAAMPWWLGLPLLLAVTAVLLIEVERLQVHARWLRLSLRWGAPGVACALGRWLGGDALAWTVAAVAALVAFTLLAGVEAWLDRHARRARGATEQPLSAPAEWPSVMLQGDPRVQPVIELTPVHWCEASPSQADPRGGVVLCEHDAGGVARLRFDDATEVIAPCDRLAFSPGGRWVALRHGAQTLLWDRDRQRRHALGTRTLCGWHQGQPWLQREATEMPKPLHGEGVTTHDADPV